MTFSMMPNSSIVTTQFRQHAQFALTDCPFRMSGAGNSVEVVCDLGSNFLLVQRCKVTHIFAVRFQPVGVMQQSIYTSIGVGMLLEQVVLCVHRELGDHLGGVAEVLAFQDLEQILAFV